METSFLAYLFGWLCGVVSDALKTVCSKRLVRWFEGGASSDTDTDADVEPEPPVPEPSTSSALIDQLYRTVARYRRGETP